MIVVRTERVPAIALATTRQACVAIELVKSVRFVQSSVSESTRVKTVEII